MRRIRDLAELPLIALTGGALMVWLVLAERHDPDLTELADG